MLLERSLVLVLGVIFATILVNTVFSIYLGKDNYLNRLLQKLSFSLDEDILFGGDKSKRLIFTLLLLVAGLILTILSK